MSVTELAIHLLAFVYELRVVFIPIGLGLLFLLIGHVAGWDGDDDWEGYDDGDR